MVKVAAASRRSGASRAPSISVAHDPLGAGDHFHHIGIYAYRRAALERFVALPPAPLERREKLEQLRALEAGMRIDVALVDTVPLGVDTPADLERAARCWARRTVETASATRAAAKPKTDAAGLIAFQGAPGAYGDLACREVFPAMRACPAPASRMPSRPCARARRRSA